MPQILLTLTIHGECEFSDKLVADSVRGQAVPSFALIKGVTRIGRIEDNTVILFDKEASRHHAVINRDPAGHYLVEDLQSTNGTFLNGTRLDAPSAVKAGDELKIGSTILRFGIVPRAYDKERGKLSLTPEATLVSLSKESSSSSFGTMTTTLWAGEMHSENYRPHAREGWALKHLTDDKGEDYFVLKNLNQAVYIRLLERDAFLWKLMDGQHSLRDILVAYMQKYHSLGADRLLDLLDELTEKGFLLRTAREPQAKPQGGFARVLETSRKVLEFFFQKQFPIQGVDAIITRVYTRLVWCLYTGIGQFALAAIALVGVAAFILILRGGGQSLFEIQGSVVLGVLALALANAVSIFLHEMAHAMTLKSYNREVRRVGVMIYFGMPTFFVDTSDIWMEPKVPRIQTSLAGPYASFLVGSVTSLIILACPLPLVNAILFKLAAWSYIDAFFNLNPLLELDGYFILMDWLEMPLLRKRSFDFIKREFWKKLLHHEAFSREEKIFALFGSLSAVWSGIAVGIFLFFEGPALLSFLHGDLTGVVSLLTVVILVAVLGLIAYLAKRWKGKAK